MIRAAVFGVWIGAVALGASTGAGVIASAPRADKPAASATTLESRKTRSLQAPVLSHGVVQGYLVAQFVYTGDAAALKALPVAPDAFLLDEALRYLYARGEADLSDISRIKVDELTGLLRERVNARLGVAVVKEVMAHELTFVSREQVRKQ